MGYHASIIDTTFKIPAKSLPEALRILKNLNWVTPNSKKRGRDYGQKPPEEDCRPTPARWFSFMPWNYDDQVKDVQDVFSLLRFESDYDQQGNFLIRGFEDKLGQEDIFLSSICHLAEGYIIWSGEGGEIWGELYGGLQVVNRNYNGNASMNVEEVEVIEIKALSLPPSP